MRKYSKQIYLTKDLFLENIKHYYNLRQPNFFLWAKDLNRHFTKKRYRNGK